MNAHVVQLLACDSELADGLTEEERAAAAEAVPVQAAVIPPGDWRPSSKPPERGHLGYLVADGLLVRRVAVAQGSSVELLGRGELLRPWQEDVSSFCEASWEVIERATVVQLGPHVGRSLSPWPVVVANLMARGIRRSRALAADAAIASIVGIEERLLILLWRLAESWGESGPEGVCLSIRLPHRLLAELLGARRPSVTSALTELQQTGRLASTSDGGWLLTGDPPF